MTKPKRHHYLPEFYLHGFACDGILQVYDKERDEYRGQQPINTAVKTHYYSVEEDGGQKNTDIEKLLAQVEGSAKDVIGKALRREPLTEKDKADLSVFVSFLWNRVPDFEQSINAVHEHAVKMIADAVFNDEAIAERELARYAKDTGEVGGPTAKEMVKFHKSGAYKIEIKRVASLHAMLSMSIEMAQYFAKMDWAIIHTPPNSSFITTDNPFFLYSPPDYSPHPIYGVGILMKGTVKLVPLSANMAVAMYDRGERTLHKTTGRQQIREMNINLARVATRFIIAKDLTLLRTVVERSGTRNIKRKGRIKID